MKTNRRYMRPLVQAINVETEENISCSKCTDYWKADHSRQSDTNPSGYWDSNPSSQYRTAIWQEETGN